MCHFFSAIVLRNGDILHDAENTDSHEDLIEAFNLRDDQTSTFLERFVRIEFLPPQEHKDWPDISKWDLQVDERSVPSWFDQEKTRKSLEEIIKRMFLDKETKFLLGGCHILLSNAKVKAVKNARIVAMHGTSQVHKMYDSSQVNEMYDSSQTFRV